MQGPGYHAPRLRVPLFHEASCPLWLRAAGLHGLQNTKRQSKIYFLPLFRAFHHNALELVQNGGVENSRHPDDPQLGGQLLAPFFPLRFLPFCRFPRNFFRVLRIRRAKHRRPGPDIPAQRQQPPDRLRIVPESGGQKYIDQEIVELGEQSLQRRLALRRGQNILAVLFATYRDFSRGKPGDGSAQF